MIAPLKAVKAHESIRRLRVENDFLKNQSRQVMTDGCSPTGEHPEIKEYPLSSLTDRLRKTGFVARNSRFW